MPTFMKYLLLQVPGWIFVALLLIGVLEWMPLSPWAAGALFGMWVVKDFVLYPFVRKAYESNVKTGSAQLIGAQGIAHERLAPYGYIRVHGELWQATAEPKDKVIAPGTPVYVRAAQGLSLIVTAAPEERMPPRSSPSGS